MNMSFSLGNIITIITLIVGIAIGWGKTTSTINEMQQLRSMDLKRIEKVEQVNETMQYRVFSIEKQNIEFKIDLQYIKAGVTEIQAVLKQKSSNNSKY